MFGASGSCPDCWQTDGSAEAAAKLHGLLYAPIIDFTVRFNQQHNTTGFPDVFDKAFNASAWESARIVCSPRSSDHAVLVGDHNDMLVASMHIRATYDHKHLFCRQPPQGQMSTAAVGNLTARVDDILQFG